MGVPGIHGGDSATGANCHSCVGLVAIATITKGRQQSGAKRERRSLWKVQHIRMLAPSWLAAAGGNAVDKGKPLASHSGRNVGLAPTPSLRRSWGGCAHRSNARGLPGTPRAEA